MLEKLDDGQLLAVDIVSYVYFHPEPLLLISSEQPKDGVVAIPLWLNLDNGSIACRQRKSPMLRNRRGMVRLPDTAVPVQQLASKHDVTMPNGRTDFVLSLLKHFITHWWAAEVDHEKIGLDQEAFAAIRNNLMQPVFTVKGIQDPSKVLNNVIMPVLFEGQENSAAVH
jgi:hypothetical protein